MKIDNGFGIKHLVIDICIYKQEEQPSNWNLTTWIKCFVLRSILTRNCLPQQNEKIFLQKKKKHLCETVSQNLVLALLWLYLQNMPVQIYLLFQTNDDYRHTVYNIVIKRYSPAQIHSDYYTKTVIKKNSLQDFTASALFINVLCILVWRIWRRKINEKCNIGEEKWRRIKKTTQNHKKIYLFIFMNVGGWIPLFSLIFVRQKPSQIQKLFIIVLAI